jgi:hypothetical protein
MSRAKLPLQSKSPPRRRVRVDVLIKQAEKVGKVVTSVTTHPDGVTLRFDSKDEVIQTADDELAQWRKGKRNAHSG